MTRIARRPDWDARLVAFARGVAGSEFEWGETDCGSLARRALEEMYGADADDLGLPGWQSLRGARRALGEGRPYDLLRRLGFRSVQPTFAQRGDLSYRLGRDDAGFPRLGIVVSYRHVMTSDTEAGVVLVPLRAWRKADARFMRWEPPDG